MTQANLNESPQPTVAVIFSPIVRVALFLALDFIFWLRDAANFGANMSKGLLARCLHFVYACGVSCHPGFAKSWGSEEQLLFLFWGDQGLPVDDGFVYSTSEAASCNKFRAPHERASCYCRADLRTQLDVSSFSLSPSSQPNAFASGSSGSRSLSAEETFASPVTPQVPVYGAFAEAINLPELPNFSQLAASLQLSVEAAVDAVGIDEAAADDVGTDEAAADADDTQDAPFVGTATNAVTPLSNRSNLKRRASTQERPPKRPVRAHSAKARTASIHARLSGGKTLRQRNLFKKWRRVKRKAQGEQRLTPESLERSTVPKKASGAFDDGSNRDDINDSAVPPPSKDAPSEAPSTDAVSEAASADAVSEAPSTDAASETRGAKSPQASPRSPGKRERFKRMFKSK